MDQLDDLLAGIDLRLSDEILGRIDEIVALGTNVGAPRPVDLTPQTPYGRHDRPPDPRDDLGSNIRFGFGFELVLSGITDAPWRR